MHANQVRRRWIWIGFLAWTGLALFWAVTDALLQVAWGRPAGLLSRLTGSFLLMYIGAALSLLAVYAASRYPLVGEGRTRNAFVHVLGALAYWVLWAAGIVAMEELGLLPAGRSPGVLSALVRTIFGTAVYSVAIYATVVMTHHAVVYYYEARERVVREARLKTRLAEAELEALRTQLQPHFLFNTLHGISGLMQRDVAAARRMIALLSDLLRGSLQHSSGQLVPLHEELSFLDRYVEIQKMRFGDRLTVRYDVETEAGKLSVPRLMLQPLVENSIRHGFARRSAPGTIVIRVARAGEELRLSVVDDGQGVAGELPDHRPPGIGLGNLQARLRQLYGDRQSISFGTPPEGGFRVDIRLPAREAAPSGAVATP